MPCEKYLKKIEKKEKNCKLILYNFQINIVAQ